MQIVELVPLINIPRHLPQVYSYFSAKAVNKYSLVVINFRKKNISALVIRTRDLNKLEIKKNLKFQLKPIKRILQLKPCLHNLQIDLAKWMANYYFEPISLILKTLLRRQKLEKEIVLNPEKGMLDKLFSFDQNLKKIIIKDVYNDSYKLVRRPFLDVRVVAQKIADLSGARLIMEEFKIKKSIIEIIDLNQGSDDSIFKADYLVLNRLGSATLIRCRDCGFIKKCEFCDAPMVYHEKEKKLICHHCSYRENPLIVCKKCKGINLEYLGQGIEKIKHRPIYTFKKDLPKADTIGVVSIDHILNLPDFKATEKAWYMLVVLNNLCRKLIIQTYSPDHYIFDLPNFWKNHIRINASLVKLTYRNKNASRARNQAVLMAKKLKPMLGPAPAFIPRQQGFYVWNMILKNPKTIPFLPSGWTVDRDPKSLL